MSKKSTSKSGGTVGIVFLLVGIVFLIRQTDWFQLPDWLFTWPVLLIVVGLVSGISSSFQRTGWIWPVLVGGAFLIDREFMDIDIFEYTLPVVFIIVGISMIQKSNRKKDSSCDTRMGNWGSSSNKANPSFSAHDEPFIALSNVLNSSTIQATCKDFKGANLTNIVAGLELDFSQVEFEEESISIEITQIMGGATFYVPEHWEIRQHYTTLLAGFEDKRKSLGNKIEGEKKVLHINGFQVLSGIQIKDIL
ncbi:hypothetical protein EWU23_07840 [Cytophagaceae bacterium 50C-KIRBA]|uniref:LiaF transmembrane domain-containing protein n=1 Tax=Aquirufa beregesia TaxID=2516556 RepID=A0ABX0EXP4_9BACT|nr:DUF5668 domain-containing protein [Aquirufa beregesia]NGZ44382.1 hypothetical protein [Aquirufa beregesia]